MIYINEATGKNMGNNGMTYEDIVNYEKDQFRRAFAEGTDEAWKQYERNVKRVVTRYNKTHDEQIDVDALMTGDQHLNLKWDGRTFY